MWKCRKTEGVRGKGSCLCTAVAVPPVGTSGGTLAHRPHLGSELLQLPRPPPQGLCTIKLQQTPQSQQSPRIPKKISLIFLGDLKKWPYSTLTWPNWVYPVKSTNKLAQLYLFDCPPEDLWLKSYCCFCDFACFEPIFTFKKNLL